MIRASCFFHIFIGIGLLAQTPNDLYEKGVYAENVLGNLEQAYQHYELASMATGADRETQARARYRMAVCAVKSGDLLRAEFAIDSLVKGFPEFPDLTSKAQALLSPLVVQEELKWLPPTWQDGEFIISRVAGGRPRDIGVLHIQETTYKGKPALRAVITINHGPYMETLVIYQTPETLKPIEVSYKRAGLKAIASGNQITVTRKNGDQEHTSQAIAEGPFYWYSQRFLLIRLLDLDKEKQPAIPYYFTPFDQFMKTTYQLGEKETVDGPLGSFEVVKVKGALGLTYWMSLGPNRHYVKTGVGNQFYELTEIGARDLDKPLNYSNKTLDFSLIAPPMWFLHQDVDYPDKSRLHLYNLDPETGVVLDVIKNKEPLRILAFENLREVRRLKTNPATTVVQSNYSVRGKVFVHYQIIKEGKDHKAVFTMWCPAQKEEQALEELNQIAASLKLN